MHVSPVYEVFVQLHIVLFVIQSSKHIPVLIDKIDKMNKFQLRTSSNHGSNIHVKNLNQEIFLPEFLHPLIVHSILQPFNILPVFNSS